MRKIAVILAVCLFMAVSAADAAAHKPARQSVGLVLSGGGAKGIAHIGVIKALEENGIPIDYITGTSMGAIVGGLYAAGYTPEEMMALLLSDGFSYWSTGRIDPDMEFYFTKAPKTPAIASIPIATSRDSARIDSTAVPASVISPLPMSWAFMQLFAKYTTQCGGDFDKLFVPFRCCASDAAAHKRVVISKGDFADAVRASMSYPLIFQATEFEGMRLYDGGIYDNFPADVMKEDFDPDFVLGIDVATKDYGPQTSLMDQLSTLVTQNNNYYLDPSNGIKISFDLNEFGLLDFPAAKAIYKVGYDQTIAMIDSIKSRIHSRVSAEEVNDRRTAFKAKTPAVVFDNVEVRGADPHQARYIKDMFMHHPADTFGMERATRSYYRAISPGKLNDLQPHAIYNDATGLYTLKLKASIKDNLKVGIGGYITSSTSSYVYLSGGYSNFRYNALEANVSAWLGQSYLAAMLNARSFLPTPFASAIEVEAVASRRNFFHDENLFFDNNNPSFVRRGQYFGRLKWGVGAGQLGKVEIGVGWAHLYDSFYMPISEYADTPYRDHCYYNLGQAFVKYESNTLSDINFPVSGRYYSIRGMAVTGKYRQKAGESGPVTERRHPKWLQFESKTRNYFTFGRHFSLGLESDVMLSTRKLLGDYNTSIVAAPGYFPTPASNNAFNASYRSNSFVALGLTPVYRYNDAISARLSINGFVPVRKIEQAADGSAYYGRNWFGTPKMYGEFSVVYSLPFFSLSAYANYTDSPGDKWHLGISFGVFMLAPEFLR